MIYGQPVTFGGASGEINITDNGVFDVKKYATANVNIEPVLLWTNASPNSNFAEQTLTFPGNYEGFIVACRYETSKSYTVVSYTYLKKGEKAYVFAANNLGGGAGVSNRYVPTVTGNSITFEKGLSPGSYQNYYCIPIYVWGVKSSI